MECQIGDGVRKDYVEAVRWYRIAAEQGDALAQYNLSLMYRSGYGVQKNNIIAHMWYSIASANGDETAGSWRAKVTAKIGTLKMKSANISEAQRRARACMASDYQDCD